MTSRMERYYRSTNRTNKRSERNERLYREIYDVGEYSNIEGIATIEKSNEVDITKIKNMLKNREQYQQQREFRQVVSRPEPKNEPIEEERYEADRTYDIRDILNKAKVNKPVEEKYHRLDDTGYKILKNLKEKSMHPEDSKEDLRELIDTITNNSELNKLATRELSLDMFEDLKGKEDTVIRSKESIRALLEEAKEEERKKKEDTMEMDKSFYTSSLNFGKDDFEEINALTTISKRKMSLMKIGLFILLVLATTGIIFLIYHLLK